MITDLKDLERFFKICRKQGVTEIDTQGISVKFGDLPHKTFEDQPDDGVSSDPTPDELMFYAINNAGQQ